MNIHTSGADVTATWQQLGTKGAGDSGDRWGPYRKPLSDATDEICGNGRVWRSEAARRRFNTQDHDPRSWAAQPEGMGGHC